MLYWTRVPDSHRSAYEGTAPVFWAYFGKMYYRWYRGGTLEVDDLSGRWRLLVRGCPDPTREDLSPHITRRGRLSMALRKVSRVAQSNVETDVHLPDDAEEYPTLWEHLSCLSYPDGSKREPSCLVIVSEGGSWKGCLSDKDNQRSLWKAGDSLQALLTSLEQAALLDDPREWRGARGPKQKRKA